MEVHARSSWGPRDSWLRTWCKMHHAWFGPGADADVFPLTPVRIYAVAALFKAGRYRTMPNYMSRAKEEHISLGYDWDEHLTLAATKAVASTQRGIGPARQSGPLPLQEVWALPAAWDPAVLGGPVDTERMIVVGAFFCMREIEVAFAMRSHVALDVQSRTVAWQLPCSKTDPKALGVVRKWGCVCGDVAVPCPFHAMAAHLELHATYFQAAGVNDLPLFPDAEGNVVEKTKVVEAFERVGGRLGLELADGNGNRVFGGHSLRVTGAQWLASQGLPLAVIQLIARWDSDVIARYVGEAPLASLTAQYRAALTNSSLEELLSARRAAIRDLDAELGRLRFALTEALEDLGTLRAQRLPVQEGGAAQPVFVQSGSGTVHVVATTAIDQTPSFDQRAMCGWRFGLAAHSLILAPPSTAERCSKCHRHWMAGATR